MRVELHDAQIGAEVGASRVDHTAHQSRRDRVFAADCGQEATAFDRHPGGGADSVQRHVLRGLDVDWRQGLDADAKRFESEFLVVELHVVGGTEQGRGPILGAPSPRCRAFVGNRQHGDRGLAGGRLELEERR